MNKLTANLLGLLVVFLGGLVFLGFVLKINYYQTATILRTTNADQLTLPMDVINKMHFQVNQPFQYYENGILKSQTIVDIITKNPYDTKTLLLASHGDYHHYQLATIQFWLTKQPYW